MSHFARRLLSTLAGSTPAFNPGADSLRQVRDEVAEMLAYHRNNSTVNVHTGEYKNPARQGYDRALTEVLDLIDAQIGQGQK